jgi:hypothetical protein
MAVRQDTSDTETPGGASATADYSHARTKPDTERPETGEPGAARPEAPGPDAEAGARRARERIGAALDDAEMLQRHLASSGKATVEPRVFADLAQARVAWASDGWTAEIDARFWFTLSRLAEAAKPVTVESLSADASGDARRMTRNYFRWTLCVGAVIVPISIYGFVNASISEPIEKWIQDQNGFEAELQSYALSAQPGRGVAVSTGAAPAADAARTTLSRELFLRKLTQFAAANREIFFRAQALNHNIFVWAAEPGWSATEKTSRANLQVDLDIAQSIGAEPDQPAKTLRTLADESFSKIATYQDIRAFAHHVLLINGTFFAAITLFLLPILYALLGALAYALRNLVRDVKDKTYLPSLSNRARLIVAVIAGTVIGLFNNFSHGISVPPLAIAFVVGYSVEVFFSFLDSLIQTIKLSTRKQRPS